MAEPLLQYGFDGVIASAGGLVYVDDKALFDCPLNEGQLKSALDVLEKNGIFRVLESRDVIFGDRSIKISLDGPAYNSELERWVRAVSDNLGVLPIEAYDNREIYKIVFIYQAEEQLREPLQVLEKDFEFCLQTDKRAKWLNGELINRRFNKGTGVRMICDYLNIALEDSIGIGDSMNDIAMIETVGTSVCMANGSKELQAQCDFVCPELQKDGLEKIFQQLGLI